MMEDDDWQAQCDLRTLIDAKDIKGDPERMAAARQYAQDQARKMAQFSEDEDPLEKGYTSLGRL